MGKERGEQRSAEHEWASKKKKKRRQGGLAAPMQMLKPWVHGGQERWNGNSPVGGTSHPTQKKGGAAITQGSQPPDR